MSMNQSNDDNVGRSKSFFGRRKKWSMTILLFLVGCIFYVVSDRQLPEPSMQREMSGLPQDNDTKNPNKMSHDVRAMVTEDEEDEGDNTTASSTKSEGKTKTKVSKSSYRTKKQQSSPSSSDVNKNNKGTSVLSQKEEVDASSDPNSTNNDENDPVATVTDGANETNPEDNDGETTDSSENDTTNNNDVNSEAANEGSGDENNDPSESENPSFPKTCETQQQCVTCQSISMEQIDSFCDWDKTTNKCITIALDVANPDPQTIKCNEDEELDGGGGGDQDTNQNTINETNDASHNDVTEEDDISTIGPNLALVFGVCLLGFVIRKKAMDRCNRNNRSFPASPNNNNFTSASTSTSIFGSKSRNPEHVPLSSTGSDDWDWDDGEMGDVELRTTKSQEDEDLEMAMALSLSVPNKQPPKKTVPIKMMAPTPALAENDSWDDDSGWDDELDDSNIMNTTASTNKNNVNNDNTKNNNASADMNWGARNATTSASTLTSQPKSTQPTTLSENDIQSLLRETQASHVPVSAQITSLGPISKPKKKTPPPPKKEEDDIFASMGFSSSLSKTSSATKNAAPKSWNNTVSASSGRSSDNAKTNISMLAADEKSESGSLWGDDDDLDGLLDE